MDSKVGCQVNMSSEPIALRFIPRVPKERKQMILISVILVLLAIIIIGAILIGVYMTQQHTEKIIKITSSRGDGDVVEQTMMVNNQESVAAFHIQSNTTSATVVYDYKHGLIGFRIQDRKQCSVVAMDSVDVPSLSEITQGIEHFDEHDSGDDHVSYSFKQGKLADRTTLGTTMNILCSDVPVYWAENNHKAQRSSLLCGGLLILKLCLTLLL
ncbi:pulmonary surfactant-associated protein C-like [Podarcis raffonei]|uniref:pulmonary surfactant-associated protein C-like n=1 Tax=Podarcis raffonei TaxID=65483 RepID=UPI0023296926|nr:pulmonary surfactant-associated protein C-like [Podarcis raffonei]